MQPLRRTRTHSSRLRKPRPDSTPATARPWGASWNSVRPNSVSCWSQSCGSVRFHIGPPVAAGRQCLHRPVTSERAIRAGPVADMPCICNNGRGGAVDGRQPSLPVGATAVNPGLQRGRGHPLLVLWRPPAAVFPAALCGSWPRHGSAARASSSAAARVRGSSGTPRPSAGNRVNPVRFPPAAFSGAFQLQYARGPPSLLDGPGVSPCGPGA